MTQCPRFERRSAPVCPLDPDWRKRRHVPGEAVCGLALEAAKPGAAAVFGEMGWGNLLAEVSLAIPEMSARWYPIKRGLEKASQSGSKMAQAKALTKRV